MEPDHRPILVDSTVIQAVNDGEVRPDSFLSAGPAVNLKPHARRAFIAAYERRLDQEVTHPVLGYPLSTRRLQARSRGHADRIGKAMISANGACRCAVPAGNSARSGPVVAG